MDSEKIALFKERYFDWIGNNKQFLPAGISERKWKSLKKIVIHDVSILTDIINLYYGYIDFPPEKMFIKNKTLFYLFVRALSVDVKWALKYRWDSLSSGKNVSYNSEIRVKLNNRNEKTS